MIHDPFCSAYHRMPCDCHAARVEEKEGILLSAFYIVVGLAVVTVFGLREAIFGRGETKTDNQWSD